MYKSYTEQGSCVFVVSYEQAVKGNCCTYMQVNHKICTFSRIAQKNPRKYSFSAHQEENLLYRVLPNNGPKLIAYGSQYKSLSDFSSLLRAHQKWSIW